MSIFIEQTPEQSRDAFAVHSHADLLTIVLIESKLKRADTLPPSLDQREFTVSFRSGNANRTDGSLITPVDFRFRLGGKGAETEVVSIFCRFEAHYNFDATFGPTEPQIQAFKKGNAVFNIWPYFREYVTSSFMRMGLPPPPVQFLRLIVKQPKKMVSPQAKSMPRKQLAGEH